MPQNIQKIIDKLEKFAPLELQEEWDNSGWQINLSNSEVSKILVTTTVTKNTIQKAIDENCDLIISHHPLIFSPVKKINNPIIISAIKNDIQIYSLHTNFDKTEGGTSEIIAKKFNNSGFNKLNDYVITSSFEKEIPIQEIVLKTKLIFEVERFKAFNFEEDKKIKKIAFCAGSGGEFIKDIEKEKIDLYITSDIKYHQIQDLSKNLCVFDVGHLESEKICLSQIKNILKAEKVEILIEEETTNAKIL